MAKIMVFCILSFACIASFAETCPVNPNAADPAWQNPFSLSGGTWIQADWKQIQGGVVYCYYKSLQLPFNAYIYTQGIQQPKNTKLWVKNAAAATLECTQGQSICSFEK